MCNDCLFYPESLEQLFLATKEQAKEAQVRKCYLMCNLDSRGLQVLAEARLDKAYNEVSKLGVTTRALQTKLGTSESELAVHLTELEQLR